MNFVNSIDFIKSFNKSILDSKYISKTKNRFEIVLNKSEKNLKTKDIANLAYDSLKILGKNWDFLIKNHKQMGILADSLKLYLDRIFKNKSKFWRVLSFLGIKSLIEYKISYISVLLYIKSKIGKIAFNILLFKEKQTRLNLDYKLKNYYFKVLGSQGVHTKVLDGMDLHVALRSLLKEFKLFTSTLTKEIKLSKILNELKFAYSISKRSITGENIKEEAEIIVDRIKKLKEAYIQKKNIPYTEVLLPGGYSISFSDSGHSVLYQITIQKDLTFNFRIINSGEGTKSPLNLKEIQEYKNSCKELLVQNRINLDKEINEEKRSDIKTIINELENTIKKLKNSTAITDICYTGLALENLSEEFFYQLLRFSSGQQICKSMDELLLFIKNKLQMNSNCQLIGSPHGVQVKGNCSFKPTTIWLKERCNIKIHSDFKTFLVRKNFLWLQKFIEKNKFSKKLEKQFKKYIESLPNTKQESIQLKDLLTSLYVDGQKVLFLREQKSKTI